MNRLSGLSTLSSAHGGVYENDYVETGSVAGNTEYAEIPADAESQGGSQVPIIHNSQQKPRRIRWRCVVGIAIGIVITVIAVSVSVGIWLSQGED